MNKILTIFKIPELSRKIMITALFLLIYRLGNAIPLPVIDQALMAERMQQAASGALGQILGFVSMFSGGNLSQATIFGLGIMPYISSSIIFQLLASVWAPLEKPPKEGESGRKKINEYTRYATVPICMLQALFWVQHLMRPEASGGMGLAMPGFTDGINYYLFGFSAILTLTAGTVFLMWIGEQIDEYG